MISNSVRLFLLVAFLNITVSTYCQSKDCEIKTDTTDIIVLFDSDNKEGVSCYRIPSIISTSNGTLIAAADERVESCNDLRDNNDINIVIRRSEDNGKSWSEIKRIVDYPYKKSASDPSMIYDFQKDILFLFYNFMDLDKNPKQYFFRVTQSMDHGKSWSDPIDITNQISKNNWVNDFKFITSGKGIQTKSGKLLHTIVNLAHGLHVFGSDDHGKTWFLKERALFPGDESKIIELKDGSWMVNSRVADLGHRYKHISTNMGKSWESKADSTLIDPACNASLISYIPPGNIHNKRFLIFSNPASKNERKNLVLRVSHDEGLSWKDSKTIWKDFAAYSSLCILNDGNIGIFFEIDAYKKIAFKAVDMNWFSHN